MRRFNAALCVVPALVLFQVEYFLYFKVSTSRFGPKVGDSQRQFACHCRNFTSLIRLQSAHHYW